MLKSDLADGVEEGVEDGVEEGVEDGVEEGVEEGVGDIFGVGTLTMTPLFQTNFLPDLIQVNFLSK